MKGPLADHVAKRARFLGQEFLTWLLVKSSTKDGVFDLDGGDPVELVFNKSIYLQDPGGADATMVKTEETAEAEEVRLAIRHGKKVTAARVALILDGRKFELDLNADLAPMRGLRFPDTLSMEPEEVLQERANMLDEVVDAVGRLYSHFLRIRVDPARWGPELDEITAWITDTSQDG